MIVLVGESGSGKSSIADVMSKIYGYEKIVSYTTRRPRDGEVDGKDYHFISEEEFDKLQSENFFLETTCYNNWLYGTAVADYADNKIAILTPRGLRQLKKILPNDIHIISFYISIPRRDRLIKILQRGDNIEEAYRRNLSDAGQFDGIEDDVNFIIYNPAYKDNVTELAQKIQYYIDNKFLLGFEEDDKDEQ